MSKKIQETFDKTEIFLYLCGIQEWTTVKLYAVVKENTQAHIVCCLPRWFEIKEYYSPHKSSVSNKIAKL